MTTNVNLVLLLPRSSQRESAAFLVHHPERARLLPKVTPLNWRRLQGVCRYSVVQLKNHLYFLGGYKPAKRKYSRQVLRYDLSSSSWYYCNKMRTGRADFQAFAFDGRIFCCGGRVSEQELTTLCESFEPVANSWATENPLPVGCAEFAVASADSELVLLLGGIVRSPNGSLRGHRHVWRFGLVKSSNPYLDYEYDWQELPTGVWLPGRGLRGHSALIDSRFGRLYVQGGDGGQRDEQAASPGLFYCDVADFKAVASQIDRNGLQAAANCTVDWRQRHQPACGRVWAAAALLGHKLFVVGGTRLAAETPQANGDGTDQASQAEALEDGARLNPREADVGYYDTRRKTFRSLFSLENCGIDTSELLAVTVTPQATNKELRPDRLDWLLQWSLW